MQCSTGDSSFTWWVWLYSVTIFRISDAAEVGHMILESTQYTKILKSLATYCIEVVHNLVGVLGHLSANGCQKYYCFMVAMVTLLVASHEKLLSHDPSLLTVVSMVTKMNNSDGTGCNFLCLWILAQLSVGCKLCNKLL